MDHTSDKAQTAVFAGGCFWCTQHEYDALPGVLSTRVGYTGGDEPDPTYELVCTQTTNYAEVVEITFDPREMTYAALVHHFLTKGHDPTQKDRQGPDIGPEYRSAIFYADDDQKAMAEKVIADVSARKVWPAPIVTTLEPLTTFWPAEDYHQKYFEKYQEKYGRPHINALRHGSE